jgi:hypothetical protein
MLGWDVTGFADIQATALNAAISGSILAEPEACCFAALALDCPAGPSTIRCRERGNFPWPVSSANWRRSSLQTLSATPA